MMTNHDVIIRSLQELRTSFGPHTPAYGVCNACIFWVGNCCIFRTFLGLVSGVCTFSVHTFASTLRMTRTEYAAIVKGRQFYRYGVCRKSAVAAAHSVRKNGCILRTKNFHFLSQANLPPPEAARFPPSLRGATPRLATIRILDQTVRRSCRTRKRKRKAASD